MTPWLSSPQYCHAERGLSFATAKLNRSRSTPTPTREMSCSATELNIEGFERARLQPGRNSTRKSPALQFAEKLGFVSGYRFSDTASAWNSMAPLGAGHAKVAFSATCLAPEGGRTQ